MHRAPKPFEFPNRESGVCFANEVTPGKDWPHQKDQASIELELLALLPTPDLQRGKRDWKLSSIIVSGLINHTHVRKSYMKTLDTHAYQSFLVGDLTDILGE